MAKGWDVVKRKSPYARHNGMETTIFIATGGLKSAHDRLCYGGFLGVQADHVKFTRYCITHPKTGKRVIAKLINSPAQLASRTVPADAELWDWMSVASQFREIEKVFEERRKAVDSYF